MNKTESYECDYRPYESSFRPTMDVIRVAMKKSRQNVAGSWKKKIPTNTVPTTPIPVHTG